MAMQGQDRPGLLAQHSACAPCLQPALMLTFIMFTTMATCAGNAHLQAGQRAGNSSGGSEPREAPAKGAGSIAGRGLKHQGLGEVR